MFREIKVTFIDNNEWKLPFNFAVGLHIAVLVGTIYIPHYFDKKPLFPDIYTVDLINLETPAAPSEPANSTPPQPEPKQPAHEIKPEPKPNSVPVIDKPQEPVAEPVKPVSIKPLKRKIVKKEIKPAAAQEKEQLEKLNRRHMEEVRRAERLAEEAARLAAMEAVNKLKNAIRESSATTAREPAPQNNGSSARSSNRGALENQYFASIFSKLQPHWQLPEYKRWDDNLFATVVIKIAKDGTITDQYFEKKSGDRLFDQFVLKALQDGSPLPPIPGAMKTSSLEIGLRFVPGSITQ